MKFLFGILGASLFAMAARPGAFVPKKDVFVESGGLAISQAGFKLILDYEVGGGEPYYNRYLLHPTYPGVESGVTVGVGYDLGYNSKAQIAADWGHLPASTVARLQACSGIKGSAAKLKLGSVKDITIPWADALRVYKAKTIPRFSAITKEAYPGTETLHPSVQGAMLSWTFNRGGGISPTSNRDLEKRLIRADIPSNVPALPKHFLASQRLWIGTSVGKGLCRRRQAEAALIQSSLPH